MDNIGPERNEDTWCRNEFVASMFSDLKSVRRREKNGLKSNIVFVSGQLRDKRSNCHGHMGPH